MNQPDVSVVIPSYNHGSYIESAVRSVLASPTDGVELVIVDDGSTDDSLERLAAWNEDPRLRLFPQQNQGAHAALNRAISLSRGNLVFILNSDDFFSVKRIPIFRQRFVERPELALLTSWLEVIDQHGASLGVKQGPLNMPPWPRPKPGPGLADLGDHELSLLETNYVSTTSNVAFRREIFEKGVCFLPLRYAHDWDFILACTAHGGLELFEEPLVSYRVHPNNTIKEGQREAEGQMRFEILWVVARHAQRLCRNQVSQGRDAGDLRRRMWNSLPRFGYESILSQLLILRGDGDQPPAFYDALLAEDHPFRRAAIRALTDAPSS